MSKKSSKAKPVKIKPAKKIVAKKPLKPTKEKVIVKPVKMNVAMALKEQEQEKEELRIQNENSPENQKRLRYWDSHIDKDYFYCTSLSSFKESALIEKSNQPNNEYLQYLSEAKKKYTKAISYYGIYGGMGTNVNYYEPFTDILAFIQDEIANGFANVETKVDTKKGIEITPTHSFNYQSREKFEHVSTLFDKLRNSNGGIVYLNTDTTSAKFLKIFQNALLETVKPIDWIKSIASLRYFIKKFPFERKYEIAAYCFTHNGNKLTHSQIKNAKQIRTKDKDTINEIFESYPFIK
ncbi:MAG TPA: hypothetical protein VNG53_06225 [Bacteroidia bacterium]|nr:hypothetical protein [Bacteroidia bacterium]